MRGIVGLGRAGVQRVTSGAGSNPQGQENGTVTTPQGPINWTRSSNGTIQAEGGGQTMTLSGQSQSDGSWHSHAEYAETGKAAYLTMDSSGEESQHQVTLTFSAGSSQLTLTVTGINALVTAGSATLSGTWNGAAVHWTGNANLNSDAFATRPIAGWPTGAFGSQLKEAAFFAPLGKTIGQSIIAQQGATPQVLSASGVRRSVGGVLGRAEAWCLGGATAGAGAGPETLGTSMLLGCVGGAGASLLGDLITSLDDDDTGDTGIGQAIAAGAAAAVAAAPPQTPAPSAGEPPDVGTVIVNPGPDGGGDIGGDGGGGDGGGGDGGGGDGGSGDILDPRSAQTTHKEN